MIVCPNCQNQLLEGELFCDECGKNLVPMADTTLQLKVDSSLFGAQQSWGTVTLNEGQHIYMQFAEARFPIDIEPNSEYTLGRGEGSPPHMDLSAHGALELGVSREHAVLRRGEGVLALVDLNSKNGTYLNGTRLAAGQPHLIHDGDEIRLGKLAFRVYFQPE